MGRFAKLSLGVAMFCSAVAAPAASIAYLGPDGSWTHQACLDLFAGKDLIPLSREELFASYENGTVDGACVPVTTSLVGVETPFIDDVLALDDVLVVAEYPKMLSYSLMVKRGTTLADVKTVTAHPVALEEVKPWLDKEMPNVVRKPAASGGAASQEAAGADGLASMGPPLAASIYGLVRLVDGIEEGPHNITRWWVLGRQIPAPTGNDKTSLLLSTDEAEFSSALQSLLATGSKVLTIYQRPTRKSLNTHLYVIDVVGHAQQEPLRDFLASHNEFKLLGSYPRKY